jgi:hypothetical protein
LISIPMNKLESAKRVVANVMDFDMHNLIPNRSPMENLEDAAEKSYEILPHKTLRERGYRQQPLFLRPDYGGNFLEKLKEPLEGKPVIEGADETNLWDFSMPEEMLKHQEQPFPRNTLDEFYDINRPGEGAGGEDLKEYWDRGWDAEDSPEISEDKWLRQKPRQKLQNPLKLMKMPFKAARRVMASFQAEQLVDSSVGPSPSVVVAHYLMESRPIKAWMSVMPNIRTAKLLKDLARPQINTLPPEERERWREQKRQYRRNRRDIPDSLKHEPPKHYHALSVKGVSVAVRKREPALGRWTFTTGSGRQSYSTVFQFIPHGNVRDPNRLHVQVNCNCPSFLYWGAQWHAYMNDYLYGAVRPIVTGPKKRDVGNKFLVCKHILACMPIVSQFHLEGITPQVSERLRQRPITVVLPTYHEKIRIPEELENIPEDLPAIRGAELQWDGWSPIQRNNFIKRLDNPDAVAYMAHRFPNTATKYVAEKLKQMLSDSKLPPAIKKHASDLLAEVKKIKPIRAEEEKPVKITDEYISNAGKQPEIQEAMRQWGVWTPIDRENFIKHIDGPRAVAFMGFTFPNSSQPYVLERLKDLAFHAGQPSLRGLAKQLSQLFI